MVSSDPVDRLLDPANRAHLGLEEQLRELLDKLDLTCSMKSSGSRSKRAKLLKKEIALLRSKLSQQHSQPPAPGPSPGGLEEDTAPPGPDAGEEGKHGLRASAVSRLYSLGILKLMQLWPQGLPARFVFF